MDRSETRTTTTGQGQLSGDTLGEIIARLVQGLNPERIYLFGSRARGQGDVGSDYDLLIVLGDSDLPKHHRESLSYDLLWGISTPVDLIVLTRNEFEEASRVRTSLASTVQTQGVLLYG